MLLFNDWLSYQTVLYILEMPRGGGGVRFLFVHNVTDDLTFNPAICACGVIPLPLPLTTTVYPPSNQPMTVYGTYQSI